MSRARGQGPHGLLLVDKASGVSSHGVVAMGRRVLRTRTVGHGGTLDPMATGLLLLGVGEGTKLLNFLSGADKAYRAMLTLGVRTDSWDGDGQVLEEQPVPALGLERVREVAAGFVGTRLQRAPAVSAIKRGGEALYKKVRRGEVVEGPLREVTVHQLIIEQVQDAQIAFFVHAKKGFYVRSLGQELAEALGTIGHLSALRRSKSGAFSVEDAVSMDTLAEAAKGSEEARAEVLARFRPLREAAACMPRAVLDEEGQAHAKHGRPIALTHIAELKGSLPTGDEPVALVDGEHTPLALAVVHEGHLRVARGFAHS